MTRSELVDRLHSRVPTLTHEDAKSVVDVILEAITRSLVADSRVEIRGFGSFSLSYRQPRVGRNPKSGEKVQIPGKYAAYFKAGKEMREGVNSRLVKRESK
ncbi:MAG: integration host factor subunit beta [Rhodocyclaceae bacterium]|nr:MAG: integration host factor subunit beta [Rhodocyclaceae bacterium]TND02547.1 MAG: integration host factor subunit beta [Rhodocyclaceae bacterium]